MPPTDPLPSPDDESIGVPVAAARPVARHHRPLTTRHYVAIAVTATVFFALLHQLGPVLTPFLVGAILAYLGTPAVVYPIPAAAAKDSERRRLETPWWHSLAGAALGPFEPNTRPPFTATRVDPRAKDQASPGMLQAPAQRELSAPAQGADEPARRP